MFSVGYVEVLGAGAHDKDGVRGSDTQVLIKHENICSDVAPGYDVTHI